MNFSILTKIMGFLMVFFFVVTAVMAETGITTTDSQEQVLQPHDENGEELPDDDMMTDED